MKICITGAGSFIGSHFIEEFNEIYEITEICLLKNEVKDIDFTNFDIVFHVAAIVHQTDKISDSEYYRVNTELVLSVAEKAKREGVKQFIFMSTVKVYGEFNEKNSIWNENSECKPADAYGQSKLNAEKLIQKISDKNFIVSIIRTPVVYGERVKANILKLIIITDNFPVIPLGNIKNIRAMVYIKNLIDLINQVIIFSKPGIFLACESQNVSTTFLVQEISKNLNKRRIFVPFLFKGVVKFLKPSIYIRLIASQLIDNTKTVNELKFKQKYSFSDGIKNMTEWYLANR